MSVNKCKITNTVTNKRVMKGSHTVPK